MIVSLYALDLFGIITGRMIQGYHFAEAAHFFSYIFLFVVGGILFSKILLRALSHLTESKGIHKGAEM